MITLNILWAVLGTLGFCIIFHVPAKCIFPAAVTSFFAWTLYETAIANGLSPVMATFFGSCAVALLSDIFARVIKEAATVFIIPGILPLVPGSGIYYTLYYFINGSTEFAIENGSQTLMTAGAISVGLISVSAGIRSFVTIKGSIRSLPEKLKNR